MDEWPSLEANKDRPRPYGWIQWKGTDVCMDVYCLCGEQMHVDTDFLYYVQCPHCERIYEVGGHVTLYPMDHRPQGHVHRLDKE